MTAGLSAMHARRRPACLKIMQRVHLAGTRSLSECHAGSGSGSTERSQSGVTGPSTSHARSASRKWELCSRTSGVRSRAMSSIYWLSNSRIGAHTALRADVCAGVYVLLGSMSALLLRQNLLHPAHFARFKRNLDSVGMGRRLRQDVLHHTSTELPCWAPPPCPPPSWRGRGK